jgi:predicted signal transduction protein with EAL and GGDEF domain
LGGDEFAVLIPSGDELATQHVAATLLQTVRDLTVPSPIGRSKWVTGSVGVARFDDNAHPVAEEIMIKADLAMYAAKKAGGNRWLSSLTGEHGGPKTRSRAKAKPRKSTKPASKKVVSPSADVP